MSGGKRNDGGPADFLTDDEAVAICAAISNGFGNGFPMNANREIISWSEWLRLRIADAMLKESENG